MPIPVIWDLQQKGADEIKQKLTELQQKFDQNKIGVEDYASGVRGLSRDASVLTRQSEIQKNILLAQYPSLNQLSRGISAFSSVANSAVSVLNMMNTANILIGQSSSDLLQIEADLAQAERDKAKAIRDGNPIALANAQERINVLTAKHKELLDQKYMNQLNAWGNLLIGITTIASSLVSVLLKIKPELFTGMVSGLGGLAALVAPFAALAAVFVAAFFAGRELGAALLSLLPPMEQWEYLYWAFIEPALYDMANFFTQTIPKAVLALTDIVTNFFTNTIPDAGTQTITWMTGVFYPAFMQVWTIIKQGIFVILSEILQGIKDNLQGGFNEITKFLSNVVDAVRNAINALTQALLSAFARNTSVSISQVGNSYSGQQGSSVVNSLHKASGFDGIVTSPTFFKVGEAGAERVVVEPLSGRRGGGDGGLTVITTVNVSGSVRSDRELAGFIDDSLKRSLKDRGWTNRI